MYSESDVSAPVEYARAEIFVSPRNHDYQRQFADSLIDSLGVQEAMNFALENGWDGVLARFK